MVTAGLSAVGGAWGTVAVALAGILLPTWVVGIIAGRGLKRYREVVAPFDPAIPWILAARRQEAGSGFF